MDNNSGILQKENIIKTGHFIFVYDKDDSTFMLGDRTKRDLPVVDYVVDSNTGSMAEIGRLHDGNGRSHSVPIR